MRRCTFCKKEFDLSNFYTGTSYRKGISYRCKNCCRERSKEYQKKNYKKVSQRRKRVQESLKKIPKVFTVTSFQLPIVLRDQLKVICALCNKGMGEFIRISIQDKINHISQNFSLQ